MHAAKGQIDDTRKAVSIKVVNKLLEKKAEVKVYPLKFPLIISPNIEAIIKLKTGWIPEYRISSIPFDIKYVRLFPVSWRQEVGLEIVANSTRYRYVNYHENADLGTN